MNEWETLINMIMIWIWILFIRRGLFLAQLDNSLARLFLSVPYSSLWMKFWHHFNYIMRCVFKQHFSQNNGNSWWLWKRIFGSAHRSYAQMYSFLLWFYVRRACVGLCDVFFIRLCFLSVVIHCLVVRTSRCVWCVSLHMPTNILKWEAYSSVVQFSTVQFNKREKWT